MKEIPKKKKRKRINRDLCAFFKHENVTSLGILIAPVVFTKELES